MNNASTYTASCSQLYRVCNSAEWPFLRGAELSVPHNSLLVFNHSTLLLACSVRLLVPLVLLVLRRRRASGANAAARAIHHDTLKLEVGALVTATACGARGAGAGGTAAVIHG